MCDAAAHVQVRYLPSVGGGLSACDPKERPAASESRVSCVSALLGSRLGAKTAANGYDSSRHDGGNHLTHLTCISLHDASVYLSNEDGRCLFVCCFWLGLLSLSYDCNWFRCLGLAGAAAQIDAHSLSRPLPWDHLHSWHARCSPTRWCCYFRKVHAVAAQSRVTL